MGRPQFSGPATENNTLLMLPLVKIKEDGWWLLADMTDKMFFFLNSVFVQFELPLPAQPNLIDIGIYVNKNE